MRYLLVSLVAALAFVGILFAYRKACVSGGWGFVDGRDDGTKSHFVDRKQLVTLVNFLLAGEQLDILAISRLEDQLTGFVITSRERAPEISVSFKAKAEVEQVKAFRAFLETSGYRSTASSNGYNGGIGPNYLETRVVVSLPKSTEAVMDCLELVCGYLQPGKFDGFFVKAAIFDIPDGVKFGSVEDPLAGMA